MNSIETHALKLIGENITTPDVFTDDVTGLAQIRASANDAVQEMCMVTGSYTRVFHLALVADRQFYRLSPQNDFIAYIVDAWDRNQKRKLTKTDLISINHIDPFWMQHEGPATHYMQIGFNTMGFYRVPTESGRILELRCACIPSPYTGGTDPVKVRDFYQQAAAYFTVSEYFASRGDGSRALEYHTKYLETTKIMQLNPQVSEREYRFQQWQSKNGEAKS